MEIKVRLEIARPSDDGCAILLAIGHWPDWTPSVTEVERLDRSASGIGSRVRIRQPRLKAMVWRVSEFNQGRFFTSETRSPGLFIVAVMKSKPVRLVRRPSCR